MVRCVSMIFPYFSGFILPICFKILTTIHCEKGRIKLRIYGKHFSAHDVLLSMIMRLGAITKPHSYPQ